MEKANSEGSGSLVSQIVSLWTFVFDQLLRSAVTLIIVWAIVGDSMRAWIWSWSSQFDANTGFLKFAEEIGFKDKLWIVFLVTVLSILYVNARLTDVFVRMIPINLIYVPLYRPNSALTALLVRLWNLKPEMKTYSDLLTLILREQAERLLRQSKTGAKADKESNFNYLEHSLAEATKRAREASVGIRKAIFFFILTYVFLLAAVHFRWADATAAKNANLIGIACIVYGCWKAIESALFSITATWSLLDQLILEVKSNSSPAEDKPRISGEMIRTEAKEAFGSPWLVGSGSFVVDYGVYQTRTRLRDWVRVREQDVRD
jgi:hypothetical protein